MKQMIADATQQLGGIAGVTRRGGATQQTADINDVFAQLIANLVDGMDEGTQQTPVNPNRQGVNVQQGAADILGMPLASDAVMTEEQLSALLSKLTSMPEMQDFLTQLQQETENSEQKPIQTIEQLLSALANLLVQPQIQQEQAAAEQTSMGAQSAQSIQPLQPQQITQIQQLTAQVTGIEITPQAAQSLAAAMQAAPIQDASANHIETATRKVGAETTTADGDAILQGEVTVTKTTDSTKQLFGVQTEFRNVIQQVKQSMQGKGKSTDSAALDVDALQAQVNANKASPFTMSLVQDIKVKTIQLTDAEPLVDQLTTGINRNLQTGSTEFTMKLKPEALGEITIKLSETNGKMTLHIVTASIETARMINSDLSALREAVKPMEVQVHEAVSQAQQNAEAQMHGFDMNNGQNRQLADQQARQHTAHASFDASLTLEDETDEVAQLHVQSDGLAALDRYI